MCCSTPGTFQLQYLDSFVTEILNVWNLVGSTETTSKWSLRSYRTLVSDLWQLAACVVCVVCGGAASACGKMICGRWPLFWGGGGWQDERCTTAIVRFCEQFFGRHQPRNNHAGMSTYTPARHQTEVISPLEGLTKQMQSWLKPTWVPAEGKKCFRQETGWRETEYAGVSLISMMSAKTFADKKQICWQKEDLLKTKICWWNLLTRNFILHKLLKKSKTSGNWREKW